MTQAIIDLDIIFIYKMFLLIFPDYICLDVDIILFKIILNLLVRLRATYD